MDFLVIRLYPRGILVIQNISSFFLFKKFSVVAQVLAGNSIMWSRYAKSKYFRSSEPYHTSNQSPLWKSILSHYQTLGEHSRWIVGKGELHFWRDNWCGKRLGAHNRAMRPYLSLRVSRSLTIWWSLFRLSLEPWLAVFSLIQRNRIGSFSRLRSRVSFPRRRLEWSQLPEGDL